MKIFSSIMAIYMLVLFLIPCSDSFEQDALNYPTNSQELSDQGVHQHKEHSDFCSPFCVCGCCGVLSAVFHHWNFNTFDFKVKSFDLPKTEASYSFIYIPSYMAEIWQPPQLIV
ncbi:DUF6660 family protein [Sphingobacterium sp. HJSM2_6]|uniref:DUF6660 family protein n=1 Tax=Sphingobacterium sp. HJSM2_6 TaxID=3366264 RepID=UPI003BC73ADC